MEAPGARVTELDVTVITKLVAGGSVADLMSWVKVEEMLGAEVVSPE